MKLTADQFLKQPFKSITSCYWLSGDEHYLRQECRNKLWQHLQKNGFEETQRLDNKSIDAARFKAELSASSLFSSKRLIELNLTQGKIDAEFGEVILSFCTRPNPDICLLISSPKLETGVAASKLFKTIEEQGTVIQCWPMSIEQLPQWFAGKLAAHGLNTSLSGLKLLSNLTEGNLLYAAQSVEKLALLYPNNQALTPEQILEVVAPQAVFDTFQLNEAFLAGDKIRAISICRNLRATGSEIILVWGALLRDIHLVLKLLQSTQSMAFGAACQKLGVWEKRRPLYRKAMDRRCFNTTMLDAMARIDQQVKNNRFGDPWLSLERFVIEYT